MSQDKTIYPIVKLQAVGRLGGCGSQQGEFGLREEIQRRGASGRHCEYTTANCESQVVFRELTKICPDFLLSLTTY